MVVAVESVRAGDGGRDTPHNGSIAGAVLVEVRWCKWIDSRVAL